MAERWRSGGTATPPGTHLLTCVDPATFMSATMTFLDATGLQLTEVVSDPLIMTPLPVPRDDRWVGVPARHLWQPLFWLPERLHPLVADDDADVEPAKTWALRVGLELAYAGLYSPVDGWRDTLFDHGIDTEDPAGLARIDAWQGGVSDPVLDTHSIEEHLVGDSTWAQEMTADLQHPAQMRVWALISQHLIDVFDAMTSYGIDFEVADSLSTIATIFLTDSREDSTAVWIDLTDRFASSDVTAVHDATAWLTAVREENLPGVHAIAEAFETGGQ